MPTATFGPLDTIPGGITAQSDMNVGKQYHFMRLAAAGVCNQASDPTNSGLLGVLQNKPKLGEGADIAYMGVSQVTAGGVVSAGDRVSHNSSGRAATVVSGQMVAGIALAAAANDGDVIPVLLQPTVRWAGAP